LTLPTPFAHHIELLTALLDRQAAIVERIEARLLNVQGKDIARITDHRDLDRPFTACFFEAPGLPPALARLEGQLHAAHLADGFEPVLLERTAHQLNPLELIVRAYGVWDRQRWPGRNGRLGYARVLYGVFMLRQLEALSLRVWDDGNERAGERLTGVQGLLDRLNSAAAPPLLIRDARWLMQTAQGPLTRHLAPYFRIADRIAASFSDRCRLEIHEAGAKLAGGHLRSQLRYRSAERGLAPDDPAVLALTRNSNSMDGALLLRDLTSLLEAYEAACQAGDRDGPALSERRATRESKGRADLADAILQGLSADPELFVTRLDLLGPCTAIDYLFVDTAAGRSVHSPMGLAHRVRVDRYAALLARLAAPLIEDAAAFEPAPDSYSPLGMAYGFSADLLSSMALETLAAPPDRGLSLEDMFVTRHRSGDKLARVRGWERLPARQGEPERFEHSAEWAASIFQRTFAALGARAARATSLNASGVPDARLFIVPRERTIESLPEGTVPDRIVPAQDHLVTSDVNRALATGATAFPRSQMLNDRNEGRFLAAAEIDGKWYGVSKTVLTERIGRGTDALIADVPDALIDVLRVTCGELIATVPARSEDRD